MGFTGEGPLVATFTGGTLVELPKLDPAPEPDELVRVDVEPLLTSDPLEVAEGIDAAVADGTDVTSDSEGVLVVEPTDAESVNVSLFGETLFAGSEVAAPDSRIAAAKVSASNVAPSFEGWILSGNHSG